MFDLSSYNKDEKGSNEHARSTMEYIRRMVAKREDLRCAKAIHGEMSALLLPKNSDRAYILYSAQIGDCNTFLDYPLRNR